MEQRLVVAGLELVRADQETIGIFLNAVRDLTARKTIELRLADLFTLVIRFPGKCDDGLVGTLDSSVTNLSIICTTSISGTYSK